ncbi:MULTISPECIES: helix-turn-helix domain-containing protein [unclassified Rhizobium]|uniref:helix-turn-helix domain-containing protein n=1 Tax=unclassified Rhizobium TaxID=2613769 RepID=UPI000AFB48A4|nr:MULTISPECIES: helix-turn-helix domain-containing protein [unclassified Rhizobium]
MPIESLISQTVSLRPVNGHDLAADAEAAGIEPHDAKPRRLSTHTGEVTRPNADFDEVDAADALTDRPLTPERRLLCMIVRQLTQELLQAIGLDSDSGGRRRSAGHVRQVAMYVCHVAYSMPMGEVAQAFGRDRSTVGHACRMVEDRRDDAAYDGFVTIVERMASAVYLLAGRRP